MKKPRKEALPVAPAITFVELEELEQDLLAAHEAEARRLEGEAEQVLRMAEEQADARRTAARESRTYALAKVAKRRKVDEGMAIRVDWSEEGVPRLALSKRQKTKE